MTALNNSKMQYVSSASYAAMTAWAGSTVTAAGTLIRQATTPAVGNERAFVCIVAGTTNSSEPTWTVTKGAKNTDNTVTWQECTGQPGVNGDTTNSPVWGATLTVVLGQIIYDSTSGALQICSVAGTTGSSTPTFSATAGVTTTDNTVTWTSLGAHGNFGAWAAPHARITNADAATWQTVIPAKIFIRNNHAETSSSAISLAGGQGTGASPNQYLSVGATVPPTSVSSGASVSTTGNTNISITGNGYYYGISFNLGTGANTPAFSIAKSGPQFYESCSFNITATGATALTSFGTASSNSGFGDFLNCTFTFANAAQTLTFYGGNTIIRGGSVAATGTVPTTLITPNNGQGFTLLIRDCDLSAITGTLFSFGSSNNAGVATLSNCKLGAGVAMTTGASTNAAGPTFRLTNCDSGNKTNRFYEGNFLGTMQQETTIVDNTNIATNGTSQISWNLTTTANASLGQPYQSSNLTQWNLLTSGSHTATIQINSNVSLTNDQIWMELECLDTSGFPIGTLVSSRASDVLVSPTTYTTSSDSWGGALTHQQYMQVTFSPAFIGYIRVRVYVAVPSTTIYINPLILVV
jgi:hypothetical protein